MSSLLAFLADVFLGPPCPYRQCWYRARGNRSLAKHERLEHPGVGS